MKHRIVYCLTLAFTLVPVARAANPFAENVRSTDPLTPRQELASFHLPPGFEIQLVAAEPDILKPMNLGFDAQGRIWATVTREYPYPVEVGKDGRDAIVILEDNDNDGRADKITRFAEGLNIPTGILPYKGGAIAWSIPNIWHFQDTDGDGRADRKERLYGPFDHTRDTHGMNSSFRRGFDGWLYATHGFNNISTVQGTDGHSIRMQSGNTYRVRLDGSRIEQHTFGQVNPFGLTFDPLGNLYSADCHSAPLYQLLAGCDYPHFGKQHNGLGFAPVMIRHSHGSTAIAGTAYYADELFPEEFRGNLFVGNVMTSRVNRDSLTELGSTMIGKEMRDFIRTDDPWFRPVDVRLGPDGALYIADFYNRIIGHYEVPLNHPGRDRTSGRIWRVVYRGEDGKANARPRRDLTRFDTLQLIAALADPNLTFRLLATHELVDRVGPTAVAPVKAMLNAPTSTSFQIIHGLWVLERLDALDTPHLQAAAVHPDRAVRTHAMRILGERPSLAPELRPWVLAGMHDDDGFVARTAADALRDQPSTENVQPLLALRHRLPADDTHTTYAVRNALCEQLRVPEILGALQRDQMTDTDAAAVADVLLAVKSEEAGAFLLDYIQHQHADVDRGPLTEFLRHIARYAPASKLDQLAGYTRAHFAGDPAFQLSLFESVGEGLRQRGSELSAPLQQWGKQLASELLQAASRNEMDWTHAPLKNATAHPWVVQLRPSADGTQSAPFLCSLPNGEQLTGTLRSKAFKVPAKLSFFLAGHDGFPDKPAQKRNVVRLRDTGTGAVLAETFPPRNDLAQLVSWELEPHAGKEAVVEITDGDTGTAYAWLAVGRFEPAVVQVPLLDPATVAHWQTAAAQLAARLNLIELEAPLHELLASATADTQARSAAAEALLSINAAAHLPEMAALLNNGATPQTLRQRIGEALGGLKENQAREILAGALAAAPGTLQARFARALATGSEGAQTLVTAIEQGKASPQLLLEKALREKLLAVGPPDTASRVERLTDGLSPASEQLQKRINEHIQAFAGSRASAATGQQVFTKNCAACHQIGGNGGLVGPQLDGIGNRGLDRIVEDVVDPNRNVDRAFRSSLFFLKDGDVASGLFRREEGALMVLADSTGKEISIPKTAIESSRESDISLMPENLSESIGPDDFNHLLAFLLSQRGTDQAP